MPTIDYFLTGDHQAAQQQFLDAIHRQQFTTTVNPDATIRVERGSKQMTFWLGAFAGKKQHIVLSASFFVHESTLVARLHRDTGRGAMAGAVGVARSARIFDELDRAVGQSLTDAGILANVVRTT